MVGLGKLCGLGLRKNTFFAFIAGRFGPCFYSVFDLLMLLGVRIAFAELAYSFLGVWRTLRGALFFSGALPVFLGGVLPRSEMKNAERCAASCIPLWSAWENYAA